jgi:hypothetical protein
MRNLPAWALCALLCASGCEKDQPAPTGPVAETESPKDSPVAYKVIADTVNNGTVEYHVLIAEGTKHDDVDNLTKYIYRHLMQRHEDPPAGVAGYVYTNMTAYNTPPRTPVASVLKKPNDLGPAFDNKVPLEFSQEIDQALGAPRPDKGFKLALKAERDDANKGVTITFPYTASGKDEWAETVSFNQAMQAFTDTAQQLFNNVPELRSLTFVGTWKDKEMVRINLARADYTALNLHDIDERIGQHHGTIFLKAQLGKEANMSPEKANAALSKENAAMTAKEYQSVLKQLKGKATISPTLK